MSKTGFRYRLSQEADRDLQDIFDYTAREFGLDQAIAYVSGFEEIFVNLAANPGLGRKRDEVRNGLRSFVKGNHTLFYRVLKTISISSGCCMAVGI
jgi:toxin ParE1/3/4